MGKNQTKCTPAEEEIIHLENIVHELAKIEVKKDLESLARAMTRLYSII